MKNNGWAVPLKHDVKSNSIPNSHALEQAPRKEETANSS